MHADMAEMTNKLENELQTLLCTALKYGSVKIQLEACHQGYSNNTSKTIVNVQRGEPGFYYPRSERGSSDIFYMDMQNYIKDNGDMWRKHTETSYDSSGKETKKDKDELRAALSDLKDPKQERRIVPEKLDAYFKLMPEVMAYRPKFLCYTEEGYDSGKGVDFEIGKLGFRILERSMDIEIHENREKDSGNSYHSSSGFQYKPSDEDLFRLLDYAEPAEQTFGSDVHERLKLFIQNYDRIRSRLEREERAKKRAYQTCQGFLKQIRVHTLPFKVLGELKK